jgi:hypothetical protein
LTEPEVSIFNFGRAYEGGDRPSLNLNYPDTLIPLVSRFYLEMPTVRLCLIECRRQSLLTSMTRLSLVTRVFLEFMYPFSEFTNPFSEFAYPFFELVYLFFKLVYPFSEFG